MKADSMAAMMVAMSAGLLAVQWVESKAESKVEELVALWVARLVEKSADELAVLTVEKKAE